MKARALLIVCSSAAFFALGMRQIRATAPTYDEPVHLASGYLALTGLRAINALDHPPFAEMWAAVPLLALKPLTLAGHPQWGRLYNYSDAFLYKNRVPPGRLLGWARAWALASWGLVFCALAVAWAWRLGGPQAAAFAGLFAASCPLLFSNAAVVGTDAASAALYAAACFWLSREARPPRVWAAAGVCAGLALAAKFNMIALPGFLAAALISESRAEPAARAPAARVALFAAAAAAALAAVYKGDLPLYWEGLTATLRRLGEGRSAFFAGERSTTGWLLYFPAALAFKTPLPLLGLSAAGAWLLARGGGRAAVWALLPPGAYLAAACVSKTQIGARHALPVVPFLVVWAAVAAGRLARAGAAGRVAAALLAAVQIASVARASPDGLTYFNVLAGGTQGGYRWFVDSNLDWGQGLAALSAELERRGRPRIYLSYFGTADPSFFGIAHCPFAWVTNVERREGVACPAPGEPALLAVSATNLQGVYYADPKVFSWLDPAKAVARPGGTFFLFDLTQDPEGRRKLAALLRMSGAPAAAVSAL